MPPKRKRGTKIGRVKKKSTYTPKLRKRTLQKVKKEIDEDNEDALICKLCKKPRMVSGSSKKGSKVCKCKVLLDLCRLNAKSIIKCKEPKCTKMFKFKASYVKHLANEHSKIPGSVSCAQCHVTCPNKDVLRNHIQDTHNRKEFECPQCKKKFVRHAHVLRHMAQSGCDGTQVAVFPCEICEAKFSRKDNLIVHLRFQHILNSHYECKHCDFRTKNFSKHVKHWQENHIVPQRYECDICGKHTSSRTSIAKHLEIHGEKKFVCNTCGYRTFTAEVLKRHVLTHVSDKPHKCDICGQSYIQRSQLQRHLEKHTGNVCDTCGQSFGSKSRLLIHSRTHLGLQRLLCPFEDCPLSRKEFSNEAGLDAHVAAHLDKKRFSCEVCNKSYHSEINMRRHMTTHKLDRPRRCMYCVTARAYIRGEQLVRHVRKHHPDLFANHLTHVRQVLGTSVAVDRVKKSEMESVLNMLDAESDRILDGYGGTDVLYGGVQVSEQQPDQSRAKEEELIKSENNPLMSEEELVENLKQLLSQLIDQDTLECFGWPDENVDTVLERVVEQMGARAADRARWSRVQRLRENTKQLFLYGLEDKHVARMLDTHTIDQVVKHILAQVADPD